MDDLDRKLSGLKRGALAAVLALILVLIGWSALAPLSSATVAPGTVSPDSGRKTIQHLEGGLLERLTVAEGDRVEAGQVIAILTDAKAAASYQTHLRRRAELTAQKARLVALAAGAPEPDFSALAADLERDPSLAAVIANEREQFRSKQASLSTKEGSIDDDVGAIEQTVAALGQQIASARDELRLTRQEFETKRDLFEKGLTTKPMVLALERRIAQVEGLIADLEGRRAAQTAQIAQRKKTRSGEGSAFRTEIADTLGKVSADLAAVEQQLQASTDAVRRMQVRSPEAGTIVSLKVRTPGAAIPPGGAIADLVPANDGVVLEVRVRPTDIARVHAGMAAQVMLAAYSQRELPLLPATVKTVSADAITDPATRETYYRAELRVDPQALAAAPQAHLMPGMPVESYITHHKRTLAEWLFEPVRRSFVRGGREY